MTTTMNRNVLDSSKMHYMTQKETWDLIGRFTRRFYEVESFYKKNVEFSHCGHLRIIRSFERIVDDMQMHLKFVTSDLNALYEYVHCEENCWSCGFCKWSVAGHIREFNELYDEFVSLKKRLDDNLEGPK